MRIFFVPFILLLLPALAGCFPGQRDAADTANYVLQGDYYTYLTQEYQNLADYERDQMHHQDDVAFLKKADAARKNIPVAPEDPDGREVPDFAREDMKSAYGQLTAAAIDRMFSPENGPLLAIAQTRFDCWVVHQEDFPQENAHISCRDGFYEAMGKLIVPDDERFDIYFDSGSTSLGDEAMDTLRNVATRFQGHEYWKIMLAGYTDGKGGKYENKTLSLRRAVAVRNALAQHGVPLDDIAIKAEGAVSKKEDADSRRVEITFLPGDTVGQSGADSFGWEHSGDL